MLRTLKPRSRRILMTVDAVGGVWRYALDLARELVNSGDSVVLAGLGPQPSRQQAEEAEAFTTLIWLNTPPDWMTSSGGDLDALPRELLAPMRDHAIDLVHFNAPTQASGFDAPCPAVVVSHSCVTTWFHAVREQAVDGAWAWQKERNRRGLDRADAVIVPSRSHADMLETCYGPIARLSVVGNSASPVPKTEKRQPLVFAAARWWDEGKNAAVIDQAASLTEWPVFAAGSMHGPNGGRTSFSYAVPLGALPSHEVRSLMARAGIFVSPSIYEPFGLAALEAAMSATPLVLSDIATYRELWDGAAMFFDARNSHDLAACLNRLSTDAELRRELGQAAMRRSRRFTLARQAAAMRGVYDKAALAMAGR
ncbi:MULTISPECIES: glycosyltransferase family 4 protein [unclassified Mesorhizobium]|uniref:glycosyltransferase family 4 protein n=1 Tax=unclassified Mesorhizobium TaxID=325217 RepID=UPI000FCC2FE1|nr:MULTISPECIES: glycosyltransferase family 4 protein [unclassified Mesorhizobium]RUU59994.1 glycosyltransferase [Mesorhizobium sp. M7A.T.Ca.TU.009.01.1.1]RUU85164.1 glycosyltransferase [Mesorhizobium sp. M7A.T.Ca.TU.009.01.1.2]RUT84711.1 glycosyltransferase [Mesorhizobium sp. M7A.T.Ca.US.000.02.1.1]RUT89808.1 glycosyltransferase [Mesorhizobium sp. M7A.T.Ca.US.000.02.2.1]RUU01839.1 glycosyltransferase [Mesorhizobium sp. M7A.T.Ca.TU.009.02.1.1]